MLWGGSSWFGGIAFSASSSPKPSEGLAHGPGQDNNSAIHQAQSLVLWETVLVVIRKHHITGTSILPPNSPLTPFPSPKAPSQLWTFSCLFCPRTGIFFCRNQGVR